jgi:hypothetical protein
MEFDLALHLIPFKVNKNLQVSSENLLILGLDHGSKEHAALI